MGTVSDSETAANIIISTNSAAAKPARNEEKTLAEVIAEQEKILGLAEEMIASSFPELKTENPILKGSPTREIIRQANLILSFCKNY